MALEGSRPPLRLLELPISVFDQLASGRLDRGVVRTIADSERSRRLLLLRYLVLRMTEEPELLGPLGPPNAMLELLREANARDPLAVNRAVTYPHTGIWAAHAVRLLSDSASAEEPTWAYLGWFNSLVASAALEAGVGFTLPLAVVHGR